MKVNMEVMESMLYFWTSVSQREKVGEAFIRSIAERDEMKRTYDAEFDAESVRLVLSAISNRELLNTTVKRVRKFWNNNMWMLEDPERMQAMIAPLKTLNLSGVTVKSRPEIDEVCFFPGQTETAVVSDRMLCVNFFAVSVADGTPKIEGKEIAEFIASA